MRILLQIAIFFAVVAFIVGIFKLFEIKNRPVITEEAFIMKPTVKIKPNSFQDVYCKMMITDVKYATQAISKNGKSWFFDDLGCMLKWSKDKDLKDDITLWVYTIDTNRWIKFKDAWYQSGKNTPMKYGFGAYEVKQNGFIDSKTLKSKIK